MEDSKIHGIWTWEHSANDLVSWWSNELVINEWWTFWVAMSWLVQDLIFLSELAINWTLFLKKSGHIHLVLGWLYIQLYHSPLHPINLLPLYFIHIPFLERLICGTSRKPSVRWHVNGGHRCSAHVNHGVLAGYWPATQTILECNSQFLISS